MATQAHDIWLILGSEWPNIVRKQNPKFLAFSPMRTKFTKKVNQAVLIAEDKVFLVLSCQRRSMDVGPRRRTQVYMMCWLV